MPTDPSLTHKLSNIIPPEQENPFTGLSGSDCLQFEWEKLKREVKQYLSDEDIAVLLATCVFGGRAHEGQNRQSGEPYFSHPIAVTRILARQRFDLTVLQVALLHDVLEDTAVTFLEMESIFGHDIAHLVDGVSKLTRMKDQAPQEVQAESFKKMLMASIADPRVIIVKLADRLHNMRTLGALRPDKRRRKALETLEMYASIAGRLGLYYFRTRLEDLAFAHLYPWRYRVVKKYYDDRFNNNDTVQEVAQELQPRLQDMGIRAMIIQRRRSLWELYRRMKRKSNLREACQTTPMRILTEGRDECYRVLGVLHGCYRPISGKFEDYIAAPKTNGYRSLHTSVVMGNRKTVLNVQIRSQEMDALAELGIVAVWHQHQSACVQCRDDESKAVEQTMRDWLSRLGEVESITHNSLEYYDAIKKELSPAEIRVYTPKGEIIELPKGATPIDFAYAIHTEVGNQCIAARVNNRPYPLYQPLKNSQTVEIITDKHSQANIRWLQFVVSAKAQAAIKHYLSGLKEQELTQLGRQLLDSAAKDLRLPFTQTDLQSYLESNQMDERQLYLDIAYGRLQAGLVVSAILGGQVPEMSSEHKGLAIHSAHDAGVVLASCCCPLPHDPLVAHIEPELGVKVHRRRCKKISFSGAQDWIDVRWAKHLTGLFVASLVMMTENKSRLLSHLAQALDDSDSDLLDVKIEHHDQDLRTLHCYLLVRDRLHLAQVMRRLKLIDGILDIKRE